MVHLHQQGVLAYIAFYVYFFSLLFCVFIISHSFLLPFIPSPMQDMYSICHMIMLRHVRRFLASCRTITWCLPLWSESTAPVLGPHAVLPLSPTTWTVDMVSQRKWNIAGWDFVNLRKCSWIFKQTEVAWIWFACNVNYKCDCVCTFA